VAYASTPHARVRRITLDLARGFLRHGPAAPEPNTPANDMTIAGDARSIIALLSVRAKSLNVRTGKNRSHYAESKLRNTHEMLKFRLEVV
jgi:hypothetical protein